MIEEAEYVVRITLTTTVQFSPIERESRITQHDAIANAFGSVTPEPWEELENAGFAIESSAERIS